MYVARSFETFVSYHLTTRRHKPEDGDWNLSLHSCEFGDYRMACAKWMLGVQLIFLSLKKQHTRLEKT